MQNKFQVHLTLKELDDVSPELVDYVRLHPNDLKQANTTEIIQKWDGVTPVIVYKHPGQFQQTPYKHVFFTHYSDEIAAFKETHPSLNIGCMAYSLATIKNLELAGVDYIQLDIPSSLPDHKLGKIPALETVIPRREEYGWTIMSLNTPVIIGGIKTLDEFKEVYALTEIAGLVIEKSHIKWADWLKSILEMME